VGATGKRERARIVADLVSKFQAFYGIQRFITIFTKALLS
jgi:hypothetical protein